MSRQNTITGLFMVLNIMGYTCNNHFTNRLRLIIINFIGIIILCLLSYGIYFSLSPSLSPPVF